MAEVCGKFISYALYNKTMFFKGENNAKTSSKTFQYC